MKWLYVTIGLLTTCVCLVGWIYLRDRDTNWRPPEPQLAPGRRSAEPLPTRSEHSRSRGLGWTFQTPMA